MKAWARKQTGFTIVELLIVIVVIAILAAITIVAYNGITTRAENTKTIQAVSAYVKLFRLYGSDEGKYPTVTYTCLGTPATCGNMTDGTDPGSCGGGQTTPKVELKTALANYTSSQPNPSSQQMNCNGKQYGGAWYYSPDGVTTLLRYYLRGSQSCSGIGIPSTVLAVTNDTTVCNAVLPTLT